MQTTSHLLMIRPVHFGFNRETAVNNAFQVESGSGDIQEKALKAFDNFVELLTAHGIEVTVINDTPLPHTPDSIFPNNWVSFHEGGTMCLYPMFALSRRQERKPELVATLQKTFHIHTIIDLTHHEKHNRFL
ncbi:MAG TPA: arginine deiminase-related protein, partial [Agriterribacter sp.]|nr:arginine deiminase-related protein [Agriterribacter sp.]